MIPAHHSAHLFPSKKSVETLRRIDRYRVAFKSMRGIYFKSSSTVEAKKAMICASSELGIIVFCRKQAEPMHRGFVVLANWADISDLS